MLEKNKKNKYIAYLILTTVTLITRIPFITRYLFEWDSVQLALGIKNFNIIQHQPHPPGYFFHIYLGKLLNLFIKNPNYSLIAINIIFTIIAGIIFYHIAKKIFKNQILATLSSLIFLTNPYIWFHGEFVNVYILDTLFALIYFYLSILIIQDKRKNLMLIFSLLFGIGIGFRQSLIIFFVPLYLFTAYYHLKNQKHYLKNILLNIIILISSTLLWLIPTIYLTGSIQKFIEITKNQYLTTTSATSILFLTRIKTLTQQTANVIKLIIYSCNILFILIIYNFIKKRPKFDKNSKTILWLWFLPSFLFYSFIHLGKAGYIMTLTPLILILGILAIYKLKSITNKYIIIFLVIIIQTASFLFNVNLINNKKFLINTAPYSINAVNLKNNDKRIEQIIETIKKYDSKDTIVIAEGDSPYIFQRTNFIKSLRHLNYYLPKYFVFYLFNDKSKYTRYYRYQGNDRRLLYQSYIPINKEIKNVLLVTDDYNYDIYHFDYADHYLDEKIFYKNISNVNEFEYIGYRFVKQY